MRNFVQSGDLIEATAPAGGVTSGGGTLIGALFGVAVGNAPEGQPFTLATKGVYDLPKRLSATFATCGAVSWDISAKRCDAPGSGRYPVGVAVEAAGNGASTVTVRLDGVSTAAA